MKHGKDIKAIKKTGECAGWKEELLEKNSREDKKKEEESDKMMMDFVLTMIMVQINGDDGQKEEE